MYFSILHAQELDHWSGQVLAAGRIRRSKRNAVRVRVGTTVRLQAEYLAGLRPNSQVPAGMDCAMLERGAAQLAGE